jgi:hypothetical protein
MLPISVQALHLIEREAPGFREAVRHAKAAVCGTRKTAHLPVRLERFDDDPFLLYACLWYAVSEKVEVRFLTE